MVRQQNLGWQPDSDSFIRVGYSNRRLRLKVQILTGECGLLDDLALHPMTGQMRWWSSLWKSEKKSANRTLIAGRVSAKARFYSAGSGLTYRAGSNCLHRRGHVGPFTNNTMVRVRHVKPVNLWLVCHCTYSTDHPSSHRFCSSLPPSLSLNCGSSSWQRNGRKAHARSPVWILRWWGRRLKGGHH